MNKDYSWPESGWGWSKKDCIVCSRQCESIYGVICDGCLYNRKHRRSLLDAFIDGVLMVVRCGKK